MTSTLNLLMLVGRRELCVVRDVDALKLLYDQNAGWVSWGRREKRESHPTKIP